MPWFLEGAWDIAQDEEHAAVAGAPRQQHYYRAYANVAARECRRGAFACGLGALDHLVEYSVGVAGRGQAVLHVVEVVVHVGEYALLDAAEPNGVVIERRSGDRQEDVDKVEGEERRQYDERRALVVVVAENEIVNDDEHNHRIVCGVAHAHKLAGYRPRQGFVEKHGGLASEHVLFPTGEYVVEVWQDAVDFVSVGVPPAEQRQLYGYAQEQRQPAWQYAVDEPHSGRYGRNPDASPYHRVGILEFRVCEEYYQQRKRQVGGHHPFEGEQSFPRMLVYDE